MSFLWFLSHSLLAYSSLSDSVKMLYNIEKSDTARVRILHDIAYSYLWTNADSTLYYSRQELHLAKAINSAEWEVMGLVDLSSGLGVTGNYTEAIKVGLEALRKGEELNNKAIIARCYNALGNQYADYNSPDEAIGYFGKSMQIDRAINNRVRLTHDLINLGLTYYQKNAFDSSLYYTQEAYKTAVAIGKWDYDMLGSIYIMLGKLNAKLNSYEIALAYYRKGIESSSFYKDWVDYSDVTKDIAELYQGIGKNDSALYYLKQSIGGAQKINYKKGILQSAQQLTDLYQGKNADSTLKYLLLLSTAKDSVFNEARVRSIQNMTYNESQYQKELEQAKTEAAHERTASLQIFGIIIFIVTMFIFLLVLLRVKAHPKMISYLGVLSLLLAFEFINLLLHPIIERITHHNPALILVVLVVIALCLAPLHKKIEKWLERKAGLGN